MGNSVFSARERNIIILIIVIVLGAILLYATRGLYGAFLGASIMYTLFRPLNKFFIERWNWPKAISAITIIVLSLVIIILPFLGIGSMLIRKAMELQQDRAWINKIIEAITNCAGDKLGRPDFLIEQLESSATYLGGMITTIVGQAANVFLEISVMYFILYFVFTNYIAFEKSLSHYMPFDEQQVVSFGTELKNVTYSNIIGQTFIAIVQGACLSLGFVIFGVSDPLFGGVICAILSFIPLLGPPLIFVPAVLILLSQGQTWQGIGLLIWCFGLVMDIHKLLRVIFAKKIGDIHPLITVVGVIIGLPLFGLMGLVFGPLLLVYFLMAVKIYKANKRLSLKREQLEDKL